ncbi:MAG: GDSL-type esterase/lipase family protein [Planctomycetota bacterium]
MQRRPSILSVFAAPTAGLLVGLLVGCGATGGGPPGPARGPSQAPQDPAADAPVAGQPGIGAELPGGPEGPDASSVEPEPRSTPLRVMPMGDSITIGYGGVAGYRLPLWMYFKEKGRPIDLVGAFTIGTPEGVEDPEHQARSGCRIGDFIEFDGDEDLPPSTIEEILLEHRPDVVLLHAGTNDLWQLGQWQDAAADLAELLDRAHAAAPGVTFVVAKLLPTVEARANLGVDWLNQRTHELVHARRREGHALQLVDMQEACPTLTTKDGVHPDFPCYLRMTQAWIAALLALEAPIPAPPPRPTPIPVVEAVTQVPSMAPLALAVGGADLLDGLHPAVSVEDPPNGWVSKPRRVEPSGDPEDGVGRFVGDPMALEFDFGAPVDVGLVEFWNGSVGAQDGSWAPRFSIHELVPSTLDEDGQWTEHGVWTLLKAGPRAWSPPEQRAVDWRRVRRVRLEVRSVYARFPEGVPEHNRRAGLAEIRFAPAGPSDGSPSHGSFGPAQASNEARAVGAGRADEAGPP